LPTVKFFSWQCTFISKLFERPFKTEKNAQEHIIYLLKKQRIIW
jgi:hypothetical protein